MATIDGLDDWLDEQPEPPRGMLTVTVARALLSLGYRAGYRRAVCRARGRDYPDGLGEGEAHGELPA